VSILNHYVKEKQRYLKNCTQCGLCAKGCPILPHTDVSELSSPDIQKGVFDFMDSGIPIQNSIIPSIFSSKHEQTAAYQGGSRNRHTSRALQVSLQGG